MKKLYKQGVQYPFLLRHDERVIHHRPEIFDRGAWEECADVDQRPSEDGSGITFGLRCVNCGLPHEIEIPWRELLEAALGLTPIDVDTGEPWNVTTHHVWPPCRCNICKGGLPIPLTHGDCRRLLGRELIDHGVTRFAQNALARVRRRVNILLRRTAPKDEKKP